MKITKIMMSRPGRQFENDNPEGRVTAIKWQVIFEAAGLFYQTELPAELPTPQLKLPTLDEVQQHIDAHPESVKPNIALKDPEKGLGFTFQT